MRPLFVTFHNVLSLSLSLSLIFSSFLNLFFLWVLNSIKVCKTSNICFALLFICLTSLHTLNQTFHYNKDQVCIFSKWNEANSLVFLHYISWINGKRLKKPNLRSEFEKRNFFFKERINCKCIEIALFDVRIWEYETGDYYVSGPLPVRIINMSIGMNQINVVEPQLRLMPQTYVKSIQTCLVFSFLLINYPLCLSMLTKIYT